MKFQLDTIKCLRAQLESIGSYLALSNEKPEDFILKLLTADESCHNIVVY